jgi:hypothetical protein
MERLLITVPFFFLGFGGLPIFGKRGTKIRKYECESWFLFSYFLTLRTVTNNRSFFFIDSGRLLSSEERKTKIRKYSESWFLFFLFF